MFLDSVECSLLAEGIFGVTVMCSCHSGPGHSRENEDHSEPGMGLGV